MPKLGDVLLRGSKTGNLHIVVRELEQFLFLFLSYYDYDHKQAAQITDIIIKGAQIKNNNITFSFPRNIRKAALLRSSYGIAVKKNAAAHWYVEIARHLNLISCQIKTRGFGKECGVIRHKLKKMVVTIDVGIIKSISVSMFQGTMTARIKFYKMPSVKIKGEGIKEIIDEIRKNLKDN
jgi:hypothetical protein